MDNVDERVQLYRELLTSVNNVFWSEYDAVDYAPLYSNAVHKGAFHLFFSMDHKDAEMPKIQDYLGKPVLRTNSLGMAWISDAEIKDGKANKIHVLGPVFLDDGYRTKVEIEMNRLQLSIPVKRVFMEVVEELPIIPLKRFYEYGIMLHYCLRKEKVGISDYMHYAEKLPETFREEDDEIHGTYEAEQQILKFVEDGNLAYKERKNKLVTFGRLGKLSSGNYLQEIKQHVMIFIALCCRAAIRGGLASETAYQLSDMYIQRLEYCKAIDNVGEVSHTMMDDYVRRVHAVKLNAGISPQIQSICDYISLNLEKKIDSHELASRLGYADYYFTKKFRREVGMSVAEFSMQKKLERVQELLKNTNISIQDIASQLAFGSPSYFTKIFCRKVGKIPAEYRLRWKEQNPINPQ